MNTPACMEWPLPESGHVDMWEWQAGRCGACGGRADDALVLDHDHETGLERGYLCRSCNRLEGVSTRPIWTLWAEGQNPASLLGIKAPYNGWGWRDGVDLLAAAFPVTEEGLRLEAEALKTIFRRPTD